MVETMKKLIAIWFLFLTAFLYSGLVVTYLGCKFLTGNIGESFCACEQVLISSQNANVENQTDDKGLVKVSHKLDVVHFFNQQFSDNQFADLVQDNMPPFPILSINDVAKGFYSSLFRPPVSSFS